MNKSVLVTCALVFLPLAIFVFILIRIYLGNPDYLATTDTNFNPDAVDYGTLARNVLNHGCFSRTDDCSPDPLRTPGYPLLILVSLGVSTPTLLYCLQAAMFVLTVWISMSIARTMGSWVNSLLAGMVLILDTAWYSLMLSSLTEVAGAFFSTLGLVMMGWPRGIASEREFGAKECIGALLLGYSVLVRPSYVLFIGGLVLSFLISLDFYRDFALRKKCIMLLLLTLIFPLCWIGRNYLVFRIPKLSTVSTNNLIYFVGAGGYQLADGIDRQTAQERISKEFGIPPYSDLQNPYFHGTRQTISENERLAASKVSGVLLSKGVYVLGASAIGIGKAIFAHPIPDFSHMLGTFWNPPGFKSLATFEISSYKKLFKNRWDLLLMFGLHLLWLICFLPLFLSGVIASIKDKTKERFHILIFVLLGLLSISLFGFDAVYRARVMLTIPACLLCGFGGEFLWNTIASKRPLFLSSKSD